MGGKNPGKLQTDFSPHSVVQYLNACLVTVQLGTDVHLGTAHLEGLRYKQVKTQNLLCV